MKNYGTGARFKKLKEGSPVIPHDNKLLGIS